MVKVVTDSSSDIPPEVAQELGITVIPLYIRFGDETYRDPDGGGIGYIDGVNTIGDTDDLLHMAIDCHKTEF